MKMFLVEFRFTSGTETALVAAHTPRSAAETVKSYKTVRQIISVEWVGMADDPIYQF